jgi:hypothetical protein
MKTNYLTSLCAYEGFFTRRLTRSPTAGKSG